MVLCTYVMCRAEHNGDIIRYEPIAAIVWKYVSMNEDTFIYETRYLCTGHGRCNILLLCVFTFLFPFFYCPLRSFTPPSPPALQIRASLRAFAFQLITQRVLHDARVQSSLLIRSKSFPPFFGQDVP